MELLMYALRLGPNLFPSEQLKILVDLREAIHR